MGIGDALWYVDRNNPDGLLGSPKRKQFELESQRLQRQRDRKARDQQFTEDLERWMKVGEIDYKNAFSADYLAGQQADKAVTRDLRKSDGQATILTRKVIPAQTTARIAIGDATTGNQIKLIDKVADATSGIDEKQLVNRGTQAKEFFPMVTDQIKTLQGGPLVLAENAGQRLERMQNADQAFIREMYQLQNPRRTLGEQLIAAMPGLAATIGLLVS